MLDKQKINDDLKASMLARDELKTSVLRMLKSEILKIETDGSHREINESILQDCIQKMVKQRRDSMEQFKNGGRIELAAKEENEINILMSYLPEQMSPEAIESAVRETMGELGIKDKSGMGKLMGALMQKLKGKADGVQVKNVVEKIFS